jgi:putative membrane protein
VFARSGSLTMIDHLPYCGTPPLPGELLARFNLDPVLIGALLLLASAHLVLVGTRRERGLAAAGWIVASAAFVSPLCALSVALFSARIAQHMILLLIAAPLIALGLPRGPQDRGSGMLYGTGAFFFVALWFWHMPEPYDSTFVSTALYWAMHVSLFGSAILLWRELLHHAYERTVAVLSVGAFTSMQMGFLGAVLALAAHPMFSWHFLFAPTWGLTPLQDQQLGGTLMWVPGLLLFVWAAIRSLGRMWHELDDARAA